MKLVALLPVAMVGMTSASGRMAAVTLHKASNVEQMREVFMNVAKKVKESGEKIDPGSAGIIQAMLDDINVTLVPALIEDRDTAQGLHDAALAAVNTCATERAASMDGEVAGAGATQIAAEKDFHNCKAVDENAATLLQQHKADQPDYYGYNFSRTWNDEADADALGNTDHEYHAKITHENLCGDLDGYVRAFTTREQTTYCEAPGTAWDDYTSHTVRAATSDAWFSPMQTWEANHHATYVQKREACHEARHRHQIRVAECHRLQHDYESKFCTYAAAIDRTCCTYGNCYASGYAAFITTNTSVAAMEVQFKAQQHALEHLLCYGDEILAGRTNLANCDDVPCTGCDRLSINYDVPHTEIVCEPVATRPCEESWNEITYGDYSAESGIVADVCQACARQLCARPE